MNAEQAVESTPVESSGGKKAKVPAWALWLLLGAAISLNVLWSDPVSDASDRLAKLRAEGLFFKSVDLPLSPGEKAAFKEATVIRRLVTFSDRSVVLTVIDATRDRHVLHDPMFCFRSAGMNVGGRRRVDLAKGWGTEATVTGTEEPRHVLSWFSDGSSQHGSPLRAWGQSVLRRITRGRSGPEPVIAILTFCGPTAPDWNLMLDRWPELSRF